jgi:hypothetical protein
MGGAGRRSWRIGPILGAGPHPIRTSHSTRGSSGAVNKEPLERTHALKMVEGVAAGRRGS